MEDQRTRYSKLVRLLKEFKGKTMKLDKIKFQVMINVGSSEQVIQESLRLMIDTGLITETDHMIFKVNGGEFK